MEDLRLIEEELKSRLREGFRKWIEEEEEEEEPLKLKYVDVEKQKRKNKRRDKKKAKRRKLIRDADHTACSSLLVDDDFVVVQILSRLPAKSLMRFKCVCKHWKSIVEHDSHFINLHHAHSGARPGFFIFVPSVPRSTLDDTKDDTDDDDYLLSADLRSGGKGANVHTIRKVEPTFSYRKILGPIGGLICLVDIFAVRMYNVSTGEVTPWIKSTVFISIEKQNGTVKVGNHPQCYFGFDPNTGKHKVIFLWYQGKFEDLPVCEVLTVGDNTWRIIDDVPPCEPNTNISGYANGSIYWFMYKGTTPWTYCGDFGEENKYSESLMAFDIGSEKFRVILIPQFTILEYTEFSCYALLEMGGCLTMERRRNHTVKLWKFHDYNKESGTSTISSEKDWAGLNIRLPSYITWHMCIYFHPIAGKDQLILETYTPSRMDDDIRYERNVKFASFYSYNLIKKTFRKFKIKGISFIPEDCSIECATFVENLVSVQKKLQH